MSKLKQINNIEVKPILQNTKKKKVFGSDLFEDPYCNIYLMASKKKGKTSIIWNILQHCITRKTILFLFVGTLDKDPSWIKMVEWLDKNNIQHMDFTSLYNEGLNQLDIVMEKIQKGEDEDEDEKNNQDGSGNKFENIKDFMPLWQVGGNDNNIEELEKKPIKKSSPKILYPEYCIICDDLSTELRDKSITKLLKISRHYKMKFIISTQYLSDLPPGGIINMDYILLFKGMDTKKLKELHEKSGMSTELDEFIKYYSIATRDKYNFLYYDKQNDSFRKNFNLKFK
jgi:hypothetical protein